MQVDEHAFVFDGKSRSVAPLERFAPSTLKAWARREKPTTGKPERYIIASDVKEKSGVSLGVRYEDYSAERDDWTFVGGKKDALVGKLQER